MSMKHTQGPWYHFGVGKIYDKNDREILYCNLEDEYFANAERIVACVNACEGINPEAVPMMVKALKDLVYFAGMGGDFASNASSLYDNAKAAIAKAAQ